MSGIQRRQVLQGLQRVVAASAGAALTIATGNKRSPAIAQERQEWRLATVWDERSDLATALNRFAQQVATAANGRLQIQIFRPSSPSDALQQVANGSAQMGHGMPEFWAAQAPATAYLMTVPFGLMPLEHYAWLHHGGGQTLADRVYNPLGCKYLPGGNLGMQAGGWFKAEINPAQGLQGLKMQSRGLAVPILQAAGVQVQTLSSNQARQALQRGDLDGIDHLGPAADLRAALYEIAPYYYFPGWQRPATMLDFFINLRAWDALAPDLQEILTAAVEAFNYRLLTENLNESSVAIETLINQHNVQIRQFPEPLLLRLESLTGEILQAQADQDPLIRAILDSLIAFRTRLTPWSRTSLSTYLQTRRWSWS